MRILCRAVPVTLLVLFALALPAGANTTIATLSRPTPVAAYGQDVVWSAYDAAVATYRLMHRGADGVAAALPVAGRAVPFDADLGPGPDGKPTLVYSRCAVEPPEPAFPATDWTRARGCDVYRFDFQTASETKVAGAASAGVSEFMPAVWQGRVAFAVLRAGETIPGVRLVAADGHARPLPGPPATACVRIYDRQGNPAKSCGRARNTYLTGLDLQGSAVAFAWQAQAPRAEATTYEIYLSTPAGRRLVASSGPGGLTQVVQRWPTFDGDQLVWSEGCFGDQEGCPGRHRFRRYRLSDGSRSSAVAPRVVVAQAVWDGRANYLTAPYAAASQQCQLDEPGAEQGCRLRQTGPIAFTRDTPARRAACSLAGRSLFPVSQRLGAPTYGTAPVLAITPRGDALAMWAEGHGLLRAALRSSAGGAFHSVGAPAGMGTVYPIRLAATARNEIIAAWSRHIGRNYRLQVAIRSRAGRFGRIQTLSGAHFTVRVVRLTVNSRGEALLAWREGPTMRIALRKPGAAFMPAGSVPSRDYQTDAALGDDGTVVVATTTTELPSGAGRGRHLVQVAERAPDGTWTAQRTLDETLNYLFGPAVAIAHDGTAVVTWSRYGAGGYVAAAATRRPGGAFGARQVLSAAGVERTTTAVAERGGSVTVAWLRDLKQGSIVEASTWSASNGFASASPVSHGQSDRWFLAAIALPGGGSMVAWNERRHGRLALFTAMRRRGSSFSRARRVAPDGAFTSETPLAAGGRRIGTAWSVNVGRRARPEAGVR